jgi:hypothetical protein
MKEKAKQLLGNVLKNRKSRFALLTVVALGIVVIMISTVFANVVLTYSIFNNSAVNATSPFDFVNGGNYATAHTLGILTNTLTAPPNQLSTTLAAIQYVNVEIYDVAEFDTAVLTATTDHVTTVTVPNAGAIAGSGLICAYAFISDFVPLTGTVAVAGEPAGCAAVTPAQGAASAACTAGTWVAGVATVNLLSGALVATPGTCNIAVGVAATTIVEYVSFAIYTNAAGAAVALNTVAIPVTAP